MDVGASFTYMVFQDECLVATVQVTPIPEGGGAAVVVSTPEEVDPLDVAINVALLGSSLCSAKHLLGIEQREAFDLALMEKADEIRKHPPTPSASDFPF